VVLRDHTGRVIDDERTITLVTSDFLASGGDGAIGRLGLPEGSVELTDIVIRDAIADVLRARAKDPKRSELSPKDHFDPKAPRLRYPGKRPVSCQGANRKPPP
jgi:hypothetical protein